MTRQCLWRAAVGLVPLLMLAIAPALAAGALAASPGELLQKAIYTEETVGNLDEAMKLYQQVIADAKTGQEAAAQAQYRLALCYLKKGQDAEARGAFETLVSKYPDATDLIAEARKHLPDALKLLPTPWTLGERAQMDMKLPTGLEVGTMIYMVDAAKHNEKDVTQCSARGLVTLNNASSYSKVVCETGSFQPFTGYWKHSLLGEASAVYEESSVTIDIVGRSEPITIDFTPPAFDNEQGVELFRRLPLEVGYKATLTVIPILTASKINLELEVPLKETITVPAGTFECYKLVLNIGQTFWISTDEHRYLVRFAAGGVTADLTKIWYAEPGKLERVDGKDFSLTLPKGWLSFSLAANPTDGEKSRLFMLDPYADAHSEAGVRPKSSLKDSERESSKAWSEAFVAEMTKVLGDFKVHEPGLVETTVSGLPATMMIANFTEDGKKSTMIGFAVIGDDLAANLQMRTSAEEFDRLRPEFEAIVESFELK